jgi:phosphoribosylformimino-5-aminoimidazole carboxamide ribotide isomerase
VKIIPAIDVLGGQVVRLRQGRFDEVTTFLQSPEALVSDYAARGVRELHLVDLDGAKDPARRQHTLLASLAEVDGLSIQSGGGIRSAEDIRSLQEAGMARVVLGSLPVVNPDQARELVQEFGPEAFVFAADFLLDEQGEPRLRSRGWQEQTEISLWDFTQRWSSQGIRRFLCTDIARDGMLRGPSQGIYAEWVRRFAGLELQASGGIATREDLVQLADAGVPTAILGRALLTGQITLEEALSC